jgi:hypothetical protein
MVVDEYFQLSLALLAETSDEEEAAGEWLLAFVRRAGSANVAVNPILARRAIAKFIEFAEQR